MIDGALTFLATELNSYIRRLIPSVEDPVQLGPVVNDDGKYVVGDRWLRMSLIAIEEERIFRSQTPDYVYVDGQHLVLEPELKLNLTVLIAARDITYQNSLSYISKTLLFFQAHSSFSSEVYAGLDPAIGKLNVELLSLSFEQLNQAWAFIGAKQLPSLFYKIRMVVLQERSADRIQPPITTIHGQIGRP